MPHIVPQSKENFLGLCEEAGATLPYSIDVSILRSGIDIKGKHIRNRIVYQAMEGCDGTPEGTPDVLTKRRYGRFARGGAGIIWFEATAVMAEGRANPRQMYINGNTLDEFKRTVSEIKEEGIRANGFEPIVICQLTHSGRYSKPHGFPEPRIAYNNPIFEGDNPIDKSAILSDDELDRISEALSHGATLAEKAGFDGADIKCCHRYLLCELLSAYERKGKYGGTLENRTRLVREAAAGAVSGTTKDFIITTRMNAYDGFPYPYGFGVNPGEGISPDFTEAKWLACELVKTGMPLIDISMGNPYVNPHVNRPFARGTYEPDEHPMKGVERMLKGIAEVASAIKGTPVISSGISYLGTAAPNILAACINEGWFDFAGFGRQTLAYPDVANEICNNGKMDKNKICVTCGKCTEIMRKKGGTPGCVVRDSEVYMPIYKNLVLGK